MNYQELMTLLDQANAFDLYRLNRKTATVNSGHSHSMVAGGLLDTS